MLIRTGLPRPGGAAALKGVSDYVTATDLASEAAIVPVLRRLTPDIPILAEEGGGERSELMWAVDPLDGTTNFTRGLPMVGVSVGLLDGLEPVVGVVIAPFLGLEFAGAWGGGATLNGVRLGALRDLAPGQAVVATGFPFRNKERFPRYRQVLLGALGTLEDLRRPGAASLDLAWTAAGTFDGFFEVNLGTWDVAAGACLVREVGGVVSDWEGGQNWSRSGDIIAAAPRVHAQLLEFAKPG